MSRLESSYFDYMGFDPENSRAALSQYVQYFTGHEPVVELASGRGEFLGLLAAAGIAAYGVDDDDGMLERSRADGWKVVPGDAVTYLETMVEPGSVGGVFSAHFFEHLVPADVERVLAGVRRALRPGGVVVTVVPNPACHAVQSFDFWRDPTHVRFYDPSLLSFFCAAAGLEVEHVAGNPRNHPGPPPHLYAELPTIDPRLGDSIGDLVLHSAVDRRGRGDPESPWRTFGHLLGTLDERLHVLQDQATRLARAHNALLEQLYPPNEVYVVARG